MQLLWSYQTQTTQNSMKIFNDSVTKTHLVTSAACNHYCPRHHYWQRRQETLFPSSETGKQLKCLRYNVINNLLMPSPLQCIRLYKHGGKGCHHVQRYFIKCRCYSYCIVIVMTVEAGLSAWRHEKWSVLARTHNGHRRLFNTNNQTFSSVPLSTVQPSVGVQNALFSALFQLSSSRASSFQFVLICHQICKCTKLLKNIYRFTYMLTSDLKIMNINIWN